MIPVEIEAAGFELPRVLAVSLAGWRHEGWRRIRGREFLALHERLNARAERVLLPFAISERGPWRVACLEVIPATERVVLCDAHGCSTEEHTSLEHWPPYRTEVPHISRLPRTPDASPGSGAADPIFVEAEATEPFLAADLHPLFVPEDRYPWDASARSAS